MRNWFLWKQLSAAKFCANKWILRYLLQTCQYEFLFIMLSARHSNMCLLSYYLSKSMVNPTSFYDIKLGYSLWSIIFWYVSTFCYWMLFWIEKPFSKDDLLQKICPDRDADEEEMLCTEKTTQFYVQHIEVTLCFKWNFT